MDKNRLYYQTPYVKSFMCTVETCEESGKGTWLAVLNQTGFYPEGGGQPSDTGTLNGVEVLSVHEKGGVILHELASPLEPGVLAEGILDWQKRYDNMQQHTGEHILSGLVHRKYGYDNVGFHMGAEEVTVDFNGELTPEQLDDLENRANSLVYANVPVQVAYPSMEELQTMDYRSKKELSGLVRIVEIPGGDVCACCGTHVDNTGEVGIIKIKGMIGYKGGVRLSMLCGRRALLDYRDRLKEEVRISNLLSAKLHLVPEAVEKLKNDAQAKDMLIGRLYSQLFEFKVQSYPESVRPLAVFQEELNPVQIRQLATLLYERNRGGIVAVCSGSDRRGEYHYALGSSLGDMRVLSKALNARLNGRGGGSALMAQGTFRADKRAIEEAFYEEADK
ncbi:MAG: alanyl-tRNA editing protein [Clostridium sp.]|nr:alanyl-tRNA editing protein [Clostridium sp.]